MNNVCITGFVARSPESRCTSSGMTVCQFAVAWNDKFMKDDNPNKVSFFNIQCWGKSAEYTEKNINVGDMVEIQGVLKSQRYTDKGGNKRVSTLIDSATVGKIFSKQASEKYQGNNQSAPQKRSQPQPQRQQPTQQQPNLGNDDIPF